RAVEPHEATVRDLEQAATDHSTRIGELEATVDMLTSQVKRLDDKCEDPEGRSRRNNMRVMGIPEGLEGPRATDFVAQLLRDLLKLDEKPLLDRAHRTLRERPKEGTPPRPFVVRVHFFHIRSQIPQRAGESSPLLYNGKRISIFPDYTSSVSKKRAAFVPVKRTLHSYPNVKFGVLFPATLKITMPNGTSHRFEDPTLEIAEFVDIIVDYISQVPCPVHAKWSADLLVATHFLTYFVGSQE
ncbi:LINE-1 retrotransposable element ORF1 protein, partial [Dissostichus eleginoides]